MTEAEFSELMQTIGVVAFFAFLAFIHWTDRK